MIKINGNTVILSINLVLTKVFNLFCAHIIQLTTLRRLIYRDYHQHNIIMMLQHRTHATRTNRVILKCSITLYA